MASWVGVVIAIAGNTVIALALSTQKLAHLRLNGEDPLSSDHDASTHDGSSSKKENGGHAPSERTHLLVSSDDVADEPIRPLVLPQASKMNNGVAADSEPLAIVIEEPASRDPSQDGKRKEDKPDPSQSKAYLRSKLWWTGLVLMIAGECGNFLSYGFAPASLVAPLGTVALVANAFISPLLLKERFRLKDLGGIALSILGALVVVLSAKQSEVDYDPYQLLHAITRPAFVVYGCVDVTLALFFAWLSDKSLGERYIFIDLGVCATAGGLTVLSTKAISTFFRLYLLDSFRIWLLYPLMLVLVLSALAQIAYLNKALARFDSREVVPTQFVLFTISAIVGSAILYRDFDNVSLQQAVNCAYADPNSFAEVASVMFGCATIFIGVYLLTRDDHSEDEDDHDHDRTSKPRLSTMPVSEALSPNGPANLTPVRSAAAPPQSASSAAATVSPRQMLGRRVSSELGRAPRTISAGKLLLSASPGRFGGSSSYRGQQQMQQQQQQQQPDDEERPPQPQPRRSSSRQSSRSER